MVSSGDKEYLATKMIKKGFNKLNGPFIELSDWIFDNYGIRPLNFFYDILDHTKQPRLQVIVEFCADLKAFKADNGLFPNTTRQENVKKAFRNFIKGYNEYSADNLYVLFNAFESIAKEEANGKISNQRLEKLKVELNISELWEIKKSFSTGIYFFYRNEQLTKYETDIEKEKLKKEYFKLIKECDEFGYLNESDFSIGLDSKENFDGIYQSNWFYYFKDH